MQFHPVLGPVVVSRNGATDTVTAILSDRLGSTVGTADSSTTTLRAFDAFGAVRNGDLSNKPDGKLALPATLHGFTQHEQVDDVRLIHMGGRVFDPALGRFLNVDPVIQNAANSQALNPYSYILNNPLSGTDPTGYESCTGSHIDRDDGGSCDEQGVSGGSTHLDNREMAKALGTRVINGFAAMWNARIGGGNGSDSQGPRSAISTPSTGAAADIGASATTVTSQGGQGFLSTAVNKAERFFAPNWVEVGERGEPGGWTDWGSGSLKEAGNIGAGALTDLNPVSNFASHLGLFQRYSIPLGDKEVLPAAVLDSAVAIGGAFFGPKGTTAVSKGPAQTARVGELIATHGRTMSNKQFDKLVRNIRTEGIKVPLTVAEHEGRMHILDGHHRALAAARAGIADVPIRRVELPFGSYKTPADLTFTPGGY